MIYPEFTLCLPAWIDKFTNESPSTFSSDQEKMRWVIELSRRNIAANTTIGDGVKTANVTDAADGGGPFGAAIFEIGTGKLVAPGVNLVVPSNCSVMHAEMVAIILAQQRLKTYVLGQEGTARFELVSSTEPCAMCMGAILWAGISRLLYGARDEDARQVGFDEGDKPQDWQQCFARRGIEVVRDLCREEAAAVLQLYGQQQGILYNG